MTRLEEPSLFGQCRRQRERNRPHVSEIRERGEIFLEREVERPQYGIAMALADLVADHSIHILPRPIHLAEKRPQRLNTQLHTVSLHGDGVGLGVLGRNRRVVRVEVPPAEGVMLRRRLVRATEQSAARLRSRPSIST